MFAYIIQTMKSFVFNQKKKYSKLNVRAEWRNILEEIKKEKLILRWFG